MNMESVHAKLRQAEAALTDAGHVDLAAAVGSVLELPKEQLQPALQHTVCPGLRALRMRWQSSALLLVQAGVPKTCSQLHCWQDRPTTKENAVAVGCCKADALQHSCGPQTCAAGSGC